MFARPRRSDSNIHAPGPADLTPAGRKLVVFSPGALETRFPERLTAMLYRSRTAKRRLLGNFPQSMPLVECSRPSMPRHAGSVHPLHERAQEHQPAVPMQNCIRIALTDDLEFLKCLRI